jgi:hypothetical protein
MVSHRMDWIGYFVFIDFCYDLIWFAVTFISATPPPPTHIRWVKGSEHEGDPYLPSFHSIAALRRTALSAHRLLLLSSSQRSECSLPCNHTAQSTPRHTHINPEDGGSMLHRNIGICLRYYTASAQKNTI